MTKTIKLIPAYIHFQTRCVRYAKFRKWAVPKQWRYNEPSVMNYHKTLEKHEGYSL